jgi:hypothetical protein
LRIREGLTAMKASEWGSEVVAFLLQEVRAERKWIATLQKKSAQGPNSRVTTARSIRR